MSRRSFTALALAITGLAAVLFLSESRWRRPVPALETPANYNTESKRQQLSGFDPGKYLHSSLEPSVLCQRMLVTPAHLISRSDARLLSEEDRICLIREYLRTQDPKRRRELVSILAYTLSIEAARLFRYSLEQEYLMRSKPLEKKEERFPEALVSGISIIAIREGAALAYLKQLANPWNVKALMSPDYPQPNPPIDLEALISYRAIHCIGATGREDAYAMLLELKQGTLIDPTNPKGRGRTFSRAFTTAAHAWDGVRRRNASNTNWLSEGMVDTAEDYDFELARRARLEWEQTPRGKDWMNWYNALPADLK